jgi:hypothetical protein
MANGLYGIGEGVRITDKDKTIEVRVSDIYDDGKAVKVEVSGGDKSGILEIVGSNRYPLTSSTQIYMKLNGPEGRLMPNRNERVPLRICGADHIEKIIKGTKEY